MKLPDPQSRPSWSRSKPDAPSPGAKDGRWYVKLYMRHYTSSTNCTYLTNRDGAFPDGGVILSGNTLYGTASAYGAGGSGTVFSISFTPQLTITLSATNVILTWPTNVAGFDYTGFTLQSTTNLVSPAVWTSF